MGKNCHSRHSEKSCKCVKSLCLRNKKNVICKPGTYRVVNSMKLLEGNTAILVLADNVHIDLCNNVLEGRGNDFNDQTIGIDFSGRSNVSVRNGIVQNFSTFGIFAQNVNEFVIENVKALNNGSPTISSPLNNAPCGGMYIGGTDDLGNGGTLSQNIRIKDVLCDQNYLWGITFPFCVNINVSDSNFVRTRDTSLFDAFAEAFNGGFFNLSPLPLASNYTFSNCKFNNAACTSQPYARYCDGFILGSYAFFESYPGDIIENITFADCEFNNNFCTDDSFEANGCALTNTKNANFMRCQANGNTCINENSTIIQGHSAGFISLISNKIRYEDCVANNQKSIGAQSLYAAGITNSNDRDVIAINVTTNGNYADIGSAYGWQTENIQGSSLQNGQIDNHQYQWIRCIANNNTSDNSNQPVAGFQLIGIDGALINECDASYNSFAGISVQQFPNDLSIMQNLIVKDTTLTANGCYGVDDIVNSNTHVFSNNIGLSNGGLNFNLQPLNVYLPNNTSVNEGSSPTCNPLTNNAMTLSIRSKSMNDPKKESTKLFDTSKLIETLKKQNKI